MSASDDALAASLGKLVPMLAGEHEGEVVAAARAIGRKLAGAGKDWHWLAARLLTAPKATRAPRAAPGPRTGASPRTKPATSGAPWTKLTPREQGHWLAKLESLRWFGDGDHGFIRACREQFRSGTSYLWTAATKRRLVALVQRAQQMGHQV